MTKLLPVDDALKRILSGVVPTEVKSVPLERAAGRVLAEPLMARRTQPPFAASAMDGYALRSAEAFAGARLRLVGESAAGRRYGETLKAGEAVRIFTGAPVPDGADAVVMQENASVQDSVVSIESAVPAGRHVRPAGLDFHVGDALIPAGRRIGPLELSLAAAANHASLAVRRRPRVALLSVGDELLPPGSDLGPDQIIACNAIGLAAIAEAAGVQTVDLGILPDQADIVAAAASKAAADNCDLLVTIGGASVGTHDITRPALADAGMTLDFWQIAMRPGKPLVFGRLGNTAVLGLPGNPVSSLVCGLVFMKPLIEALLGLPAKDWSEPAVLGTDVPANDGVRQRFMMARLVVDEDGTLLTYPLELQDSSLLSPLASCDCLLLRAADAPPASAGSPCRVMWLR